MKRYFLIVTAVLLLNNTYSQQYYPLVEENKTWYVVSSFFGGNERTYIHKCEGDTLIGGESYKTVFMSMEEFPVNWTTMGYIREDVDHKVYFSAYKLNDISYFNPLLLYDFGAEINDTLTISSLNEFTNELEIIITRFDSVLVDGDYHKRTWFDCEYFPDNYWIEGIGSNSGLLEVGFYCTVVCPGLDMGCVKKDGQTIYPNGFSGSCYVVGIDEFNTEKVHFMISPNPATDNFIVKPITQFQSNISLELFNSVGNKVNTIYLNKNQPTKIKTDMLETGLYLYNIYNENQIIQKGKIIIQGH